MAPVGVIEAKPLHVQPALVDAVEAPNGCNAIHELFIECIQA